MTPAELRKRLHSSETSFGTLIVSPSPRWPEVVKTCGLDFVFIDTEHIALDRAPLSWMCQTYAALGLPPLVRIPSPDPYAATKREPSRQTTRGEKKAEAFCGGEFVRQDGRSVYGNHAKPILAPIGRRRKWFL